ncbi:sulfur controller-2 [Fusarium mundagurra]|uniref:Sulfur controller-2 n=1 Tax=Fusarium mundagurra TaxID=1567541 RepID=A0A8H5XRH4_9HYPO|nr:sulfur controller-2 [Fusarium mundagurra]
MRQHRPSLGGSQGQSKRKLAPQLEVDSDTKEPLPLRPTKRQRTENDCPSLYEVCCFPQTRPWKDVYKERFMIGLNWNHGRFRTRMFEGHTDSIMCLQFDAAILATGSYDATIKLWDLETGKLRRSLVGSKDKTIKIWNFDDKESFTLRGHKDDVNSVQLDLHSRTLLSASDDFTLRLWDLTTRQCIKTFEGHCGQVQQVSFLPPHLETALSRSDAEMISDPAICTGTSTPSARSALAGDFLANPDRVLPPQYAVSAGLDNTLRLWDIFSGKCVRVFFGHTDGVWALAADILRIVSGAGDAQVKVWDLTKTECTRTIPGHREPVTCVSLSDAMFCTGSDDGQARLFDFRPEAKF